MGSGLYFIRLKDEVLTTLQHGGYLDVIGTENIFCTKGEAITFVFNKLDAEIGNKCNLRIYLECGQVPGKSS